jgi:excisionase family DNA binding protein
MKENEAATEEGAAKAPAKRPGIQPQPLYLRPSKAAKLLDIGRSKMYELIQAGEVRAIVIGGNLRIPMSEIEALGERRLKSE